MTTRTDATDEFLVKAGRFFTPGDVSEDLRTVTRHGGREGDVFYRDRWSHDKVGAIHPRGELHRVLFVEGVRQGRRDHLGDPADRLPVGRPRTPRVRAARLPARRRVLLVHLLAHPDPLSVRAVGAARGLPGREG